MNMLPLLALLTLGDATDSSLVVHEWGTFTSVSGPDGEMMLWRPLTGPEDLPGFIVRGPEGWGRSKVDIVARVRMETPVIYFYAKKQVKVSVDVRFPGGKITEWFPPALSRKEGIGWLKVEVVPGADPRLFPQEEGRSHYYAARETDAAPVRIGKAHEKFLFYRGVGDDPLPIRAKLVGDRVTLEPVGPDPMHGVIVFENHGGTVGFRSVGRLEGSVTLDRPVRNSRVEEVWSLLEKELTGAGLYPREARAMIETWKDSWFEEGLRVFYLLPRSATDALLPLTIRPEPQEIVRVMVGRAELVTPELERRVRDIVAGMNDRDADSVVSTWRAIHEEGRFAEPAIRHLLLSEPDPATRQRLKSFLPPERGDR